MRPPWRPLSWRYGRSPELRKRRHPPGWHFRPKAAPAISCRRLCFFFLQAR